MKKYYFGIGFVIITILAVIGFIGYPKWANRAISYVTISINPEVELALNSDDEVVEVIPVNSDADILVSDLDLEGLTIEEATEKIIDSAMETGYLDEYSDENTVVVTTVNDDDEDRKELEEKVMTKLNTHFEARNLYGVLVARGLDDELKSEADNYGISYGKMLLVDRALSLNTALSKDDLVTMSIQKIQSEIKSYVEQRHDALKVSLQEAKVEWQAQKTILKQKYTAKIEALKASITEEHKEEFQNMTAVQKKEAIKNYLQAKKNIIKEDINTIKEEIKAEVKEEMKNYNYPILEDNSDTIKEKVQERIENRKGKS